MTTIAVHTERLSPLSVGVVTALRIGTNEAQQEEMIQLLQNVYSLTNIAFTDLAPLPAAAAQVTEVQTGPSIQRITLSPAPYDGTFDFTLAGQTYRQIPFDVTGRALQAILGAAFVVTKKAANAWQIESVDPGAVDPIEVDVSNLVVPTGKRGALSLNTAGIYLAFAGTTARELQFTLEVQLQFPGEDPQTIFQGPVTVSRNVINLSTIAAETLLGLQKVYSALGGSAFTFDLSITGLRGGGTNLDAVPTAEKVLGYRYDFWLNNMVNTFKLVAGPADGGDPTGQVAPLDYNAVTNDKHWERQA